MGKKAQRTPEERTQWKAEVDDQLRRLHEAIARRKAALARERRAEDR
jgi:hypothetical protein